MARRRDKRADVIWCDRGWFPVYFGFCPSERAWKYALRRLKVGPLPYPQTDARTTTLENKAENNLCVIVTVGEHIDQKEDRLAIFCLIVHEAAHVWQAIREHIGETAPSHEFEAYALQRITSGLASAYSKTRKRL